MDDGALRQPLQYTDRFARLPALRFADLHRRDPSGEQLGRDRGAIGALGHALHQLAGGVSALVGEMSHG